VAGQSRERRAVTGALVDDEVAALAESKLRKLGERVGPGDLERYTRWRQLGEAIDPLRSTLRPGRSSEQKQDDRKAPHSIPPRVTMGPLAAVLADTMRGRQERQPCAFYSITSSARARSEGGTVSPRALAVLRLMTSLNVVGCSTGMSPGLTPDST